MPDDHPAAPYAEGFDQVALKKWLGDWGKALTPSKPLGRRLFHVSLTGLNLVLFGIDKSTAKSRQLIETQKGDAIVGSQSVIGG